MFNQFFLNVLRLCKYVSDEVVGFGRILTCKYNTIKWFKLDILPSVFRLHSSGQLSLRIWWIGSKGSNKERNNGEWNAFNHLERTDFAFMLTILSPSA